MISIVIPTLNEAKCIGSTLSFLEEHASDCEVIVVDGGSTDTTKEICRSYNNVQLFQVDPPQRASQMNRGAKEAKGEVLIFLHADTLPPTNFQKLINTALSKPEVIGGAFSLKFDADHWMLKIIAGATQFNLAWLTFGDHGMFLRKTEFFHLGGYKTMPILEDLDFQVRLRKQGVFVRPKASVITSARRFTKNGVLRQTAMDVCILLGYFIGISPDKLTTLYPNTPSKAR